jgi:putative cardiolipin synthase
MGHVRRAWKRLFGAGGAGRAALAALGLAALAGCASLPPLPERGPTRAVVASEATSLGRLAIRSAPAPGMSGFRLLPTGGYAFDARVALIRNAERSVDVQYYILQNDSTGQALLRELRAAAARGVRVRLLLDDMYTAGSDPLLLSFAHQPGVEMRLFNPFPAARERTLMRFVAAATDFWRVSRRMHNKLLVADGAMAVAGGRNIADEYFMRNDEANFIDLDMLAIGPVTGELEAQFDRYWNSPVSYPIQLVARSDLSPQELRDRFDQYTANAKKIERPAERDPFGHLPLSEDIQGDGLSMVWADAEVYADLPEKVLGRKGEYAGVPLEDTGSVRFNVVEALLGAQKEVLMASPYLVPGQNGMAVLRQVRERGVDIAALTNSLASTDEMVVHTGYRRYRDDLLRIGVRLHEFSPNRVNRYLRIGLFQTPGRLHTKSAVIDSRQVFIGSMNMDPRSERHNTELGLILDSPELGSQVRHLLETEMEQSAYLLRLKEGTDDIEWVSFDGEEVFDSEPDVTLMERIILNLIAPLTPEDLI